MIVIDTDILIDHFHGNEAAKAFIREKLLSGETLTISVVTVSEIIAGMRSGEEQRTEMLFGLFNIFPVDVTIARIAGAYLNRYPSANELDLGDVLIAATALVNGAELYTRNVRHYPMDDIIVKIPYERGKRG